MIGKPLETPIEHLLRELAPQMLGLVIRRFHDFASAEDAVQEAMFAAPAMAGGRRSRESSRLVDTVAFRRMTDQCAARWPAVRRENVAARDVETVAAGGIDCDTDMDPDDTLILLFLCCHPALTSSSSIALTLRAVGGLTTAEIASAFLVPEATMAQRISRAKQSIKASGLPFRSTLQGRAERLRSVLHALYLIFKKATQQRGAHFQRLELSVKPSASRDPFTPCFPTTRRSRDCWRSCC